jgi:hypothetical protein
MRFDENCIFIVKTIRLNFINPLAEATAELVSSSLQQYAQR